ncbi:MAG: hypothetical protein LBP25_05975 [Tannerellaceae bacterium]|jgi:hypothetical protein|nr:hypothetical protein [Tannerellaceae bacterium]
MLVRIVKDWHAPDLFRQTPGYSRMWEGIEFTESNNSQCDLLVVLNAPRKNLLLKVSPEARWLFSQESPIELYKWHIRSFRYFSRVYTFWDKRYSPDIIHSQTALPWHINKSYDELLHLTKTEAVSNKKKTLSWITSDAKDKDGHILRMSFKDFLLQENMNFDLWGRGFTPIDDKFDGLYPYKYSIAIENHSCNDYWTEKITDCFLSWTVPVYYGAKNITKYFPEKSMILIDPNDRKKSLSIIQDAIENNLFEEKVNYIEEARDLILNKYQFFPFVTQLIRDSNIDFSNKKWCLIPKNNCPKPSLSKRLSRMVQSKK